MKCYCTCFYFYRWGENFHPYCEFYQKLVKDIDIKIKGNCSNYKEKTK